MVVPVHMREAREGTTRSVDELPEGTVSFLFSDIEGSTRLLERFGDQLTEAMTAHHELLARAVDGNDGVVFETVGDAVYAAFADPASCARGALAAQRAMLTNDWGPLGDVRIRVALHRGAVERHGSHYVGPPLFRTARILALAHGGQTLASAEMAAALAATSLPDLAILDLGRHRLKDLVEAEQVHQLDAPDLPSTFPPLRSTGSRFDNLPRPTSTFVGRERELAEVASTLAAARLVSLLGPGGSGKTRLAVEAAARLIDGHQDGAAFVDLAPIRDPALIGPTISSALGIRSVGDETPEAAVARWLRDKDLLLVVDNCEQVIDGAPVLARLLESAPAVRVLATSRERLRLRGERSITLGPLDGADDRGPSACARLFCDRAALDPDSVSEEALAAIEELGRRLDGLPLAVELAAARADVIPPKAMLERLERGSIDLGAGDRDLPARQRTLRATIEWSLDLLGPEEARLFAALGVFAGGWSVSAAERVCGAGSDGEGTDGATVLDALASLLDKSLIRPAGADPLGDPRYRFLETIRDIAVERLAATEQRAELERRHVAWIVELVERAEPELIGPAATAWLHHLRDLLPDIRRAIDRAGDSGDGLAARRIAGALAPFWWRAGTWHEGLDIARRTLATAPVGDPLVEARAMLAAAEAAQQLGLLDEARPLGEAAVAALEPLGPSRDLARALQDRGIAAAYGRRADDALAALEQALSIWHEVGDAHGSAFTTQAIGQVHAVLRGDAATAEPWTAEAYEIARRLRDPFARTEAASVEAESLLLLEQYPEAADVLAAAIAGELATGSQDPLMAAQIVGQAGMLAAGTGADDDAARLHGFCVDRHAELIGRPDWLAAQWEPLERTLADRLGPAIRDALMADGAGLTTEAALEASLAQVRRVGADQPHGTPPPPRVALDWSDTATRSRTEAPCPPPTPPTTTVETPPSRTPTGPSNPLTGCPTTAPPTAASATRTP